MPSRLDTNIRRSLLLVTAVVAISSAALSYQGLTSLGRDAGLGELSPLLAVAIDGTVGAGMLGVLHATVSRTSTVYSWFLVVLGLGASVWGNAAPAVTTSDKIVHGIAPVALALSLEALTASLRRRVVDEHAEAQAEAERAAREAAAVARAERRANASVSKPTVRRTGTRSAKHDPETVAKVRRLREGGASYREIEEATGVSKSRVGALLAQQSDDQPVVRDESEESAA